MKEYLHIKEDEECLVEVGENNVIDNASSDQNALEFIKENVKEDVIDEDIELYKIQLDDWTVEVDNSSKLLEPENMNSLLAVVAYSFETNIDLEIPE